MGFVRGDAVVNDLRKFYSLQEPNEHDIGIILDIKRFNEIKTMIRVIWTNDVGDITTTWHNDHSLYAVGRVIIDA